MKIIEITNDGIWFEDSYGSECYMPNDDVKFIKKVIDSEL
jgi:hypothetical protein|tara:strand:- start:6974 stop:7093 length:120 start_codon:yes stop_codon:yes gene_type:complete